MGRLVYFLLTLPFMVSLCGRILTCLTHALAAIKTEIATTKGVPILAVRLYSILGRKARAAQNIRLVIDQIEMGGIATVPHMAQVVAQNLNIRDDSNEKLVQKAMDSKCLAAFGNIDIPVAPAVFTSLPLPTRRSVVEMLFAYFNVGKDFRKQFSAYRQSARILVGHFCSFAANLIKAGRTSNFCRPSCILAQEVS